MMNCLTWADNPSARKCRPDDGRGFGRGLLPDVPVAGELDWLGFVADDLAHHLARLPEQTRHVRLLAAAPEGGRGEGAGGGGGGMLGEGSAGLWTVTTRRRFDGAGGLLWQVMGRIGESVSTRSLVEPNRRIRFNLFVKQAPKNAGGGLELTL
jgi:hypothetical protein